MIPNEEKERWHYLVVKKLSVILHGLISQVVFIAWILSILLEQKINLNLMRKYQKIKISVEL